MRFAFTEEQDELRAVLRRFLADRSPVAAARKALGSTHDQGTWTSLAQELGLQSVHVPEDLGGQGLGAVELAIVMEELGRVLYPGPFLSSAVLATDALVQAGAADDLATLLTGQTVAALALPADTGDGASAASAELTGDAQPAVSGHLPAVIGASTADLLLVVARRTDGPALLVAVDVAGPGVRIEPLDSLDGTRPVADVHLETVPARVLAESVQPLLARTRDRGLAALAAEAVGVAGRCLDMTLDHVRTREQFDVPIGSFQVVKHRCADMLVDLEHARSAAYVAACRADEGDPDALAEAASLALAVAVDTARRIAAETVQLHGGIGFTWEHDAHLYVRRAQADAWLLGSPSQQRRRLWDLTDHLTTTE